MRASDCTEYLAIGAAGWIECSYGGLHTSKKGRIAVSLSESAADEIA